MRSSFPPEAGHAGGALDRSVPMPAADAMAGESGQRDVAGRWLAALDDEDPACARAAGARLETLLARLSGDAFGRWVLTGMRLYPNEPARREQYFRLEDARAIAAFHAEAGAGDLSSAMPSLTLLLEGLSGRRMHIQPRSQFALHAAPLRPVLASGHLLLPDDYTSLDAPDRYQLYRAAVAHAVAHLRYSPAALPVEALKPMSLAVVAAVEDARVERLLVRDCPGTRAWFVPLLEQNLQAHGLGFAALISRMSLALMEPAYQDDNYWVNKARTLFDALGDEQGDYAACRRVASVLANDLGQMRVRFHPQQYAVPAAYRDDNAYLWDYGNPETPPQAQELEVQSHAAFQAAQQEACHDDKRDAQEPVAVTAVELRRALYPEWDYRLARSRSDWCTVIERSFAAPVRAVGAAPPQARAVPVLTLARRRHLSRDARLRRQLEGETLDLDAAIELAVERRLDLAPEPRLFIRPASKARVSSILLLLDVSASTNDVLPGAQRSVLDMEKEAAIVLARAASASGHRIAVHGFSSDTRASVNYYRLLDFGAAFDDAGERAIWSLTGQYSTRMGAALRHAGNCLRGEPGDHRAVIVITDGAPSDVDVFDHDYLIRDAQAAVDDGWRAGVASYGIAVDPGAAAYMRTILGHGNFRIASEPAALPAQLAALYARLAAA
ncbi:VWA domain-containing protein [Cupriavidus basilensis]|uniref:VWA domain-containing protein n=1 Tax=Cupriavidus basilensis TaxID=68895 RepID=A0ABT6B1X8_9BURK|nr:VWA domain-containing protein [Cupriavidus basilensis]MDF3838889.1 VWA domain-containing protein [Cupriavidus basilensis]